MLTQSDKHRPINGGEYHPRVDKSMVVGNEVTRIFTLGQWSIAQVVNQDEKSEITGDVRERLIQKLNALL